jgi:hypothetical protein
MNKTRSPLHMFSKNFKLIHRCFKSSPSIYSNWIDRVDFLYFWPNKIRVGPTDVVSSLSLLWCHLSSGRHHHATALCHTSFPWSQDEFTASTSSFDNVLSCHLPSRAEIEPLNLHHHCQPPFPDSLTPTLYYYKKVISILSTLSTTQLCLYFASSLARASRHRSSTHHHLSLSPSSNAHRPSAQWHPRW